MQILESVKRQLTRLHTCSSAYVLAHAAWSACDHRALPGPSLLEISSQLDESNKRLVNHLMHISSSVDYRNDDQAEMLRWLDKSGYSAYVAKQVKMTKKKAT